MQCEQTPDDALLWSDTAECVYIRRSTSLGTERTAVVEKMALRGTSIDLSFSRATTELGEHALAPGVGGVRQLQDLGCVERPFDLASLGLEAL
jgi:hypothetical protein